VDVFDVGCFEDSVAVDDGGEGVILGSHERLGLPFLAKNFCFHFSQR
jgi:hypothetical protein